jgi:cytoskeletal protein RodZ
MKRIGTELLRITGIIIAATTILIIWLSLGGWDFLQNQLTPATPTPPTVTITPPIVTITNTLTPDQATPPATPQISESQRPPQPPPATTQPPTNNATSPVTTQPPTTTTTQPAVTTSTSPAAVNPPQLLSMVCGYQNNNQVGCSIIYKSIGEPPQLTLTCGDATWTGTGQATQSGSAGIIPHLYTTDATTCYATLTNTAGSDSRTTPID